MKNEVSKYIVPGIISIISLCILQQSFVMADPIKGGLNAIMTHTNDINEKSVNEKINLNNSLNIKKGNQLISVSLRESDLKQVLRMFADKCGLNIIFHESVSGNITLDLVNVTLNNALSMIMKIKGLSYIIENDTILIMSNETAKTMNISRQSINIIPIKYANASKVADFLNNNIFGKDNPGLSNNEVAVTNGSKNEVLIFGSENDYEMAKKVVKLLDKKPTLTIFKVNHTTPREMSRIICETLFIKASKGGSSEDKSFFAFQPITDADSNQQKTKQEQVSQTQVNMGQIGTESTQSITLPDVVLGGQTLACQINSDTESKVLKSYDSSLLSILFSQQAGTITMVGGSESQIALVSDFIKDNDKKAPQAFIEVSIIELNESGSKEFNNSWQVYSKWFTGAVGGGGLSTSANSPIFWSGNPGNGVLGLINAARWGTSPVITQTLTYLVENRKGRVLANPRILTTNGKTSVIDLSSDYVKTVTSEVLATAGYAGGTQRTYEIGEDNGMKIALIPFISPDGYISLNIKPMYATIKERIYQPTANQQAGQDLAATLLQRRNLDLKNVRIKDGETLVLGGLIQDDESQEVSKTPILGDIPVLGMFFRDSRKNREKTELVITITPHIIKEDTQIDTEDL